jgi:outer membrane protein TolC
VAYTQRDQLLNGMGGADFFSAGISMNIPLYFWRKQRMEVQEKRLRQKRVDEHLAQIRNEIAAELDDVLSRLHKNAELLELYRTGVIPQAQQSLQSAMNGYQTDKVDFLTLVNNQLTLFQLQLEYERILSNYQKNKAELQFISGGLNVNSQ